VVFKFQTEILDYIGTEFAMPLFKKNVLREFLVTTFLISNFILLLLYTAKFYIFIVIIAYYARVERKNRV